MGLPLLLDAFTTSFLLHPFSFSILNSSALIRYEYELLLFYELLLVIIHVPNHTRLIVVSDYRNFPLRTQG